MKNYILEACVDSVESAVIATNAGANRLELCSNLIIGGTTPTLAMFQQVRKRCDNKIHVLIRPRFGDFCYTEDEFEVMREEVRQYKKFGADDPMLGDLNLKEYCYN
jgi:copper homeostasis protein